MTSVMGRATAITRAPRRANRYQARSESGGAMWFIEVDSGSGEPEHLVPEQPAEQALGQQCEQPGADAGAQVQAQHGAAMPGDVAPHEVPHAARDAGERQ